MQVEFLPTPYKGSLYKIVSFYEVSCMGILAKLTSDCLFIQNILFLQDSCTRYQEKYLKPGYSAHKIAYIFRRLVQNNKIGSFISNGIPLCITTCLKNIPIALDIAFDCKQQSNVVFSIDLNPLPDRAASYISHFYPLCFQLISDSVGLRKVFVLLSYPSGCYKSVYFSIPLALNHII